MKKIAIMTWIHYPNYGSILQAFALKTYLTNLGYDVELINYCPKKQYVIDLNSKKYNAKKVKEYIKNRSIKRNLDLLNREHVFNEFIKENLKLTKRCETDSQLATLNKEFDYFICGSDQIWSPIVFDKKYFLNFVEEPHKMIAYAPSMGGSSIQDANVFNEMKKLISRFSNISIREEQGKEIIKNMINIDVPVVCDPTMLLSKEEWNSIAAERKLNKKYVVAYFLGDSKFYWKYLEELDKKGYDILLIPTKHYHYNKKYKVIENLSPNEFLEIIKGAEATITDSYHGTIFAHLFEVPFLTLQRFKNSDYHEQNSRLITLLKDTGNIERLVNSYEPEKMQMLSIKPNLDKQVEMKICNSKNYLNKALSINNNKVIKQDYSITPSCSGCGVCIKSCPKNAIEMKINKHGFYEATINKELCVTCEICKNICGFNNETKLFDKDTKVIAARAKSSQVLSHTTSGGLAYTLSKLLLKKGYNIIGCTYDIKMNKARHIYIDANRIGAEDEITQLCGSKYLQSFTVDAWNEIKIDEKTAIIGTPCQIASLNNYFLRNKCRDKFILIDLICHGVPTYKLWDKYLEYIKKEYNIGQIKSVVFRKKVKVNTNNNMNLLIEGTNSSVINSQDKDLFYRSFCIGNCYNESCYECNFRKSSGADIRLGDYWGDKYEDKNGTSMVILVTEEGEAILKELETESIDCFEGSIEDYMKYQQTFNLNPPFYYEQLMNNLNDERMSLKEFDKIYCGRHYNIKKIKKSIKLLIRRK